MGITEILSSKKRTFEDAKKDLFKKINENFGVCNIVETDDSKIVEIVGIKYKIIEFPSKEIVAYTRIKDAFGDYEKQPITARFVRCALTQIK